MCLVLSCVSCPVLCVLSCLVCLVLSCVSCVSCPVLCLVSCLVCLVLSCASCVLCLVSYVLCLVSCIMCLVLSCDSHWPKTDKNEISKISIIFNVAARILLSGNENENIFVREEKGDTRTTQCLKKRRQGNANLILIDQNVLAKKTV